MFAGIIPKSSTKQILKNTIQTKNFLQNLTKNHKNLVIFSQNAQPKSQNYTQLIEKSQHFQKRQFLPVVWVRLYARKSTRTQTQEEQRTQTQNQTELEPRNTSSWVRDSQREYEDETTEDSLSRDVKAYLAKVYGTLMGGLGMAAIGCFTSFLIPPLALVGMIGGFIGVISLAFTNPAKATLRQNIFLGTGALLGMGIGPLIAASSPGAVFAALLGTSAIFGGFSLAAYRSKRGSMLKMGGVLISCLLALVVLQLSALILPLMGVTSPAFLGAVHSISLYGGLGLFSLFVAYDTQRMIEDYHQGNRDHVGPALNMFLNVFNIFIRLLQIFRGD